MANQALQCAQARLDQLQKQCDEAFLVYEADPTSNFKKECYRGLLESLHKAEDHVSSLATAAGAASTSGTREQDNLTTQLTKKVMGYSMHEPCNMILTPKQLVTRFHKWDWTVISEGPNAFRIRVLNPKLINPKGHEQYIIGDAGQSEKWSCIDKALLHLLSVASPARRLCCLHATLAVEEADGNG